MKSLLVFAVTLCLSAPLVGQATDDAPSKLYGRFWIAVGGADLAPYSDPWDFYFKGRPGIDVGASIGGNNWGMTVSCFSQSFRVDLKKTNEKNAPFTAISLTDEYFNKVETNGILIGPYITNGLKRKGLQFDICPGVGVVSTYFPAYRTDGLSREASRTLHLAYSGTAQVRYRVFKRISIGVFSRHLISRFDNDDFLEVSSWGIVFSTADAL